MIQPNVQVTSDEELLGDLPSPVVHGLPDAVGLIEVSFVEPYTGYGNWKEQSTNQNCSTSCMGFPCVTQLAGSRTTK